MTPIQDGSIESPLDTEAPVAELVSGPALGAPREGNLWCHHCNRATDHFTADHPMIPEQL